MDTLILLLQTTTGTATENVLFSPFLQAGVLGVVALGLALFAWWQIKTQREDAKQIQAKIETLYKDQQTNLLKLIGERDSLIREMDERRRTEDRERRTEMRQQEVERERARSERDAKFVAVLETLASNIERQLMILEKMDDTRQIRAEIESLRRQRSE